MKLKHALAFTLMAALSLCGICHSEITSIFTFPSGSNTYVQYNDGGYFGGDSGMTYNETTDLLTCGQVSTATGTITALTVGTITVTGTSALTGALTVSSITVTNTATVSTLTVTGTSTHTGVATFGTISASSVTTTNLSVSTSVVSFISASSITATTISGSTATLSSLTVNGTSAHTGVATFGTISASSAVVTNFSAPTAAVGTITASSATATTISGSTATLSSLTVNGTSTFTGVAAFGTISASSAVVTNFAAPTAAVGTITGSSATATNLSASTSRTANATILNTLTVATVSATTSISNADGTSSAPTYTFANQSTLGMYRQGASALALTTPLGGNFYFYASTTVYLRYDTGNPPTIWVDGLQTKSVDLGTASLAFDDMYADDFNNVADIPFFDYVKDMATGKEIAVDDLAVLRAIQPMRDRKGNLMFNEHGHAYWDDSTAPDWLWFRGKKDKGQITRDSDGKPWVSMKVLAGLALGAAGQLAQENAQLKADLQDVKTRLAYLESKINGGQ